MKFVTRRTVLHKLLCLLLAALSAAGSTTMALAQQGVAPSENDPGTIDLGEVKPVELGDQTPREPTVRGDTTLLTDAETADRADVAYALPNTCVAAVIRPAQILNSPAAEMFPIEVMQAAMIKETSLDPLAAEQVVVSASPPGQGPPAYSMFLKFNKRARLKEGELTRHAAKASLEGKEYFQSKEMMAPSFYPVDEKSLLAAPDFMLQQLVGRQAPEVPRLAAELAAADKGDDLLMLVDLEALQPLVMMAVAEAQLPPELASLQEIPALVKRAELRVNVSRPQPTELIVAARDEAGAERVVAIFNGMKQLLATKMMEESQKALASDDPVEQAGGRYSQRMMKYWDAQMQLVREGDRLILFRVDMANNPQQQLTYIATIGVLVGLLLPAVQAAREAARRNVSINNMKQLLLALLVHADAKKALPAYANFSSDGKPLLSWRVHILPYLEQQALYEQFHLDEPWDSQHNKTLISRMPEVFLDPSSGLAPSEGKTHYLGVKGEGYFFDGTSAGRRLKSITDGLSNTVAVVQVGNAAAVPWTKPDDWTPDANNVMKPFDPRLHASGFIAGFCDGSVRFVSEAIDEMTFKALLTVAGQEDSNVIN